MSNNTDQQESAPPRGRWWTLAIFLLLFLGVFVGNYRYVFPRFGQEPVSPTSSLRLHEVLSRPDAERVEVTLPDRAKRFIAPSAILEAQHFSAFRCDHKSGPTEVVLLLSEAGLAKIESLTRRPKVREIVAVINDRPIAVVAFPIEGETQLKLVLRGLSQGDANEVLARLTE
ncbi:hypothetical protein [Fuerstiella marisgermanici]|uniref:Preprotein translocase subunit SecD n=1 Tax=Fuerstiella marisgermanici TaxID=1891926 RepID=A0A1P8WAB1_9PLAN|nr:hypothetical protein [Fuerstiella marisgermanici]APZ90999.1 hypothetical protein Fuma_00583 [Fuerstiella marisgermanici]